MFRRELLRRAFPIVAMLAGVSAASAQESPGGSWLDRSLTNWNRQSARIPSPPAPSRESALPERCRDQVRQPASALEREAVRKGWTLFGPAQSYGTASVFTAMAGVDEMCRPLGYQGFVYVQGRYAGTLSPVPMNSRADGSLTGIRLLSASRIRVEFARYAGSDPRCCPSKTSAVYYGIGNGRAPELTPVSITTLAACPTYDQSEEATADAASLLFGARWVLTQIAAQRVNADKPYVEFGRQQAVSGDSGCNQFSGALEVSGTLLKISEIVSTKRACLAPEANRLETDFLRSLQAAKRFDLQRKTLRLYAGDRLLLTFSAR